MTDWLHFSGTSLAAFLASLVEFTEALTIVLAVGVTRGWRVSLFGAAAGTVALGILLALFGPLLTAQMVPLKWLKILIGALLIIFAARWLRKAVLRAAGIIPLHDEDETFTRHVETIGKTDRRIRAFDKLAFLTSMKAVFIEGMEVVFIVVAVGAAETSLGPAITGALAALAVVVALGCALHKPLSRIPENALKYGVAIILMAFGIFWFGEGIGIQWSDMDILGLMLVIFAASQILHRMIRKLTLPA